VLCPLAISKNSSFSNFRFLRTSKHSSMSIIILEGNISAGKSTLCQKLQELDPECRSFLEPTLSNPYLELFYADPPKYALKMQMWLFRQRYKTYLDALRFVMQTGRNALLDRSVYSDWIFAEKNRIDGNISQEGYQYYMGLRHHLLADLPLPHATIYLNVSPEVCFERIHKLRQRDCESTIPVEYLAGLDECYGRLLSELQSRGSIVLSFDWNSFGNAADIFRELSLRTFSTPKEQWMRVKLLLDELGQDSPANESHLWPKHLSGQALLFDEPDSTHPSHSNMEEEAMLIEKPRTKKTADLNPIEELSPSRSCDFSSNSSKSKRVQMKDATPSRLVPA